MDQITIYNDIVNLLFRSLIFLLHKTNTNNRFHEWTKIYRKNNTELLVQYMNNNNTYISQALLVQCIIETWVATWRRVLQYEILIKKLKHIINHY